MGVLFFCVVVVVRKELTTLTNGTPRCAAAFLTQTVCLDDITVKFEIWDTAGQERYHSLAPMYYRGAQAAIVVYDVTNTDTFVRAKNWVKELQVWLGALVSAAAGMVDSSLLGGPSAAGEPEHCHRPRRQQGGSRQQTRRRIRRSCGVGRRQIGVFLFGLTWPRMSYGRHIL